VPAAKPNSESPSASAEMNKERRTVARPPIPTRLPRRRRYFYFSKESWADCGERAQPWPMGRSGTGFSRWLRAAPAAAAAAAAAHSFHPQTVAWPRKSSVLHGNVMIRNDTLGEKKRKEKKTQRRDDTRSTQDNIRNARTHENCPGPLYYQQPRPFPPARRHRRARRNDPARRPSKK